MRYVSSVLAAGGMVVTLGLMSGCAVDLEPAGIKPHAGYSASGVAWSYRTTHGTETILVGEEEPNYEDDLGVLRDIWSGLPGLGANVSIEHDAVSSVLLITLQRDALQTDNPLRGGARGWWYRELYHRLQDTVGLAEAGTSEGYRHSVHLAARSVDDAVTFDAKELAQVRLRSLAAWLIEDGLDPRQITAQIVDAPAELANEVVEGPSRPIGWEMAIALRPYRYGDEMTAANFLPAHLYPRQQRVISEVPPEPYTVELQKTRNGGLEQ